MKRLVWLRRDLRLKDHRALSWGTQTDSKAAVCFVFDETIIKSLSSDDRRLSFIHDCLSELDRKLRDAGSRLIVTIGDPIQVIPKIAKKLKVNEVVVNEDYEPKAKKRDQAVEKILKENSIRFKSLKDQVIFSGGEILNQSGSPYRVFTPYKKNWLNQLSQEDLKPSKTHLDRFIPSRELSSFDELPTLKKVGFDKQNLILVPGEDAAKKRLREFKKKIDSYQKNRDFVHLDGTSSLSPHLRFGTLSIREAVRMAYQEGGIGAETWLSELIWREFYQMILDRFPYVEKKAFREEYQNIRWPGKQNHFAAWCEGRTGYPIVDAAMRHFNRTGWMHNRLRMIVASFLVKDLLIDWKKGEAYFAQLLLDFDLASNNGGWQWCASTGVDAQPYFRVFNPTTQAKKFDPLGEFIRSEVSERSHSSSKELYALINPIVDHSIQRNAAIELMKGK